MKSLAEKLPAGQRALAPKEPTVPELLAEKQRKAEQGPWYPASGGTEEPFWTRGNFKLLYCWQPSTGKHAYLNCQTDIFLSNEEASEALGN